MLGMHVFHMPHRRGWYPIYAMAELLVQLTGAERNEVNKERVRPWAALQLKLPRQPGDHVGLLIANDPTDLKALTRIRGWRAHYSTWVAWIVDSMAIEQYPAETAAFGRLLVSRKEDVAPTHTRTGVPTDYLPMGTDALKLSGVEFSAKPRTLDLFSFGRQLPPFDGEQLRTYLAERGLRYQRRFPFETNARQNQQAMFRLLLESKFSLAFCASLGYHTGEPAPARITPRVLDSLAAGCAVLGVRPKTADADELLGWKDATPAVDADPQIGFPQLYEHIRRYDPAMAWTHRLESLRRNDWRLRFQRLHELLGLRLPEGMQAALEALNREIDLVAKQASQATSTPR